MENEVKGFNCEDFRVNESLTTVYIYNSNKSSQYLFSDGKVRNWSEISDYNEANKLVYFKTTEEAKEFLRKFKQIGCAKREEQMVNCKDTRELKVDKNTLGFYIYVEDPGQYLHSDGRVGHFDFNTGYFQDQSSAKKALQEFQEKMCKSANVQERGVVSNQRIHLHLENETPLIQPITARLVTDHSGERIVLQVRTPETPEFIAVARLAVRNGKVVMFREQGVESEFINTDGQGRIQN